MAARTHAAVVKTQVAPGQITWHLEFFGARKLVPLRLQKWRVVGDDRTARVQMRDYATTIQAAALEDEEEKNEETVVPVRIPSQDFVRPSSPTPLVEEELMADRGQSSSLTHSIVVEAETMISPAGAASPSSGSEFNYADGYISGQEEIESDKEEVDDDDVELTIKDAHSFKVFQDEETREPASILDLDFDSKKDQRPMTRLHLMGCASRDSSGLFMRTIDSWNVKPDGERNLKLYVRDTKDGSWIKLCMHSKEYEVSVHDALIITKFLELAMRSKETEPKKFLDQLVGKIGSKRAEIKRLLSKYYSSVLEKFVQSENAPPILQKSPIIKKMESVFRGKVEKGNLEKEKLTAPVKRPSQIGEKRLENNLTPGAQLPGNKKRRIEESDPNLLPEEVVQKERKNTAPDPVIAPEADVQEERKKTAPTLPISNKRKRVVESDTENDSDSEDHVPLAQRQFSIKEKPETTKSEPKDEQVENTKKTEDPDAECGSRKHGQESGACADTPPSHVTNKDDSSLRWGEEGVDFEGEQEYLDIAEIYGGQSGGIGEIEDDDDEELGESAFCAICDDGGDVLLCDGPCMRSFHASKESSALSDSRCRSLGYKAEEVREMASWLCPNCVHNQHQCFICGNLGKSDGDDKEVYVCDVALCGRFYHPTCLAKWKKKEKFNGIADEDAFIQAVKEGVECPAHKCRKCGEGENEGGVDNSMNLAKCRRCPKAYHKLCLPKKISFEGRGDEPVRAWEIGNEDDPMKRLVMYCLDHEIIEHLSTPARNHLKWPKDSLSPQNIGYKDGLSGIQRVSPHARKQQKVSKSSSSRQIPVHADDDEIIIQQKSSKGTKVPLKQSLVHKDLNVREQNPLSKPVIAAGSSVAAKDTRMRATVLALSAPAYPPSKLVKITKTSDPRKKNIFIPKNVPTSSEGRQGRVLDIIRRASQNVTLETVKKTLVQPSCYAENRKKTFLQKGELQSLLNAIRKAAEKVKNGGSMEDAKRLCPKDKFIQMLRTADMLSVHLAPILHGMRYSSFGRHFTCPDKLKEIVNRIHPYIDSGDMIVDFCCGANDFSIILNEKLLSTGKTCHFKNFDIHPPKNDFCFSKGDWLQNPGHGFLEGRKLIMGLNPPFGVRAQLANRFIIHALKFRPKLLVLIVPPEAMSNSMGYKSYNYDLVWEDKQLLQGHAFYLPGSVDDNDSGNMTQWNKVPPPLYLWSSRDTIQKHQDVAVRCGHIEGPKIDPLVLPNRTTPTPPPPPARDQPRLKIPSDKWTNSGSTPTECETSSSRLQYSSTTSSQNSLDGPGLCLPVGGHHGSLQNPSQRGHASGEQASDPTTRHVQRTASFGHGPVGHTLAPVAGPPQNNRPPVLPHQNLNSRPIHAPPEQNSASGQMSGPSASDLHSKHLRHLNQSSPRGNQPQWIHPGPRIPQRPQILEPPMFPSPQAGSQLWPVRPPQISVNDVFPPLPVHGRPQGWQAPQPHFIGQGLAPTNALQGTRRHPQEQPFPTPMPPVYYEEQSPPPFERRPGGNPHDNGSGGWLD